jgi:hypothetical protein
VVFAGDDHYVQDRLAPENLTPYETLIVPSPIAPLTVGEPTGLVSAFLIRQPDRKRLDVHLINYEIDYAKDLIREKTDVALSVPRPAFLSGNVFSRLYAGEDDPRALDIVPSEARLRFSVPQEMTCRGQQDHPRERP